MTVKELIDRLREMPEDCEVYYQEDFTELDTRIDHVDIGKSRCCTHPEATVHLT